MCRNNANAHTGLLKDWLLLDTNMKQKKRQVFHFFPFWFVHSKH